jgi:hypothetical protein
MLLEQAVGRSSGHHEVRTFVEERLDAVEPRNRPTPRARGRRT